MLLLIKEVKGIEHGQEQRCLVTNSFLQFAGNVPDCVWATQMWCTVYSDLNKNVNEGLLVPLADDIS